MADKAYFLSEEDVRILRQVVVDSRRRQRPPRVPGSRGDDELGQTPEVYLVRSPATGLPGLSEATTGTSSYDLLDDQLVGTECQIYRLDDEDTIEATDLTQTVYNVSELDIAGNTWVLAVRDKFGTWFAVAPAGGGSSGGPGHGPGGGSCSLAMLHKSDCVLVYDGTQEIALRWNGSRWSSNEVGTVSDQNYRYPGGEGPVEFWYDTGRLHLSIDGMELLDCGDTCFTGGPLTGHTSDDTGTASFPDCSGETFTVCVECTCCPVDGWAGPGWYCADLGEDTGTGTDCTPNYLGNADRCNYDIVICSGPYDSEEEATAVCGPAAPCTTTTPCCSAPSCMPETLYFHWSNMGVCGNGTVALTWSVDHWGASSVNFGGACSAATIRLDCFGGQFRVQITGPFTETTTFASGSCEPFSRTAPFLNWTCCAVGGPTGSWTINETP